MAIDVNQHDVIRGLFSGMAPASSESPVAFMRRSSQVSGMLLMERRIRNKQLLDSMKAQNKELKGISKSTGDGLGLVDLVLARYTTKMLNSSFRLGARGIGYLGAGSAVLLRGIPALTGKIFSGVFGGIAESVRLNVLYVSRVGIPSLTKIPGLGPMLSKGGLLMSLSGMVSSSLALGKKLISPALLGKLFWPLTAAYSLYLGVNAYKGADKILGKPVNSMFKRMQVGITETLNGLLFGLPDRLAKHFGAEGFSKWIDGGVQRLGAIVTQDIPAYLKKTTYQILSGLRTHWNNFDLGNALAEVKDWIRNSILSLGAYIGSGILNTFKDVANTVSISSGRHGYRGSIPPKPSSGVYMPNQDEDKASSLIQLRSSRLVPLIRSGAITAEAAVSIPRTLTVDSMQKDEDGRIITNKASITGGMPNKAVDWFNKGNEAMQVYGQSLATSHASETVVAIAPTQQGITDGLLTSFSDAFNSDWLDTMSGFLGNIPEILKKQSASILNSQNMATIGNIMAGNAPSFDMAGAMQGIGAPVQQMETMPGSVPYQGDMPNAPIQTNPILRKSAEGRYRGGELGDGVSYTTSVNSSASSNPTKREVTDAMLSTGADPKFVAAITGNVDVENPKWDPKNEHSDPSRSNPSQRAAGLVQWDQHRTNNLKSYAAEKGLDPLDAKTQGLFALEEANPKSKYRDAGAVKAARIIAQNPNMTAGEAASTYMMKSERPAASAANATMARRMAAAERNYSDIQQKEKVVEAPVVSRPKMGSNSAYPRDLSTYQGVAYGGMKPLYTPMSPPSAPMDSNIPELDSRGNVNLGYTGQTTSSPVKMASQVPNVRMASDAVPLDLKKEVDRAVVMQQANQPKSVHDGPDRKKELDRTKDDNAEDLEELSMLLYEDVGQQSA